MILGDLKCGPIFGWVLIYNNPFCFDRPCSQIDEEIEDIEEDEDSSLGGGSSGVGSSGSSSDGLTGLRRGGGGGGGGSSGLDDPDDSEMTYVNNTDIKQVNPNYGPLGPKMRFDGGGL